jgi:uncharacterized integral membrane protein
MPSRNIEKSAEADGRNLKALIVPAIALGLVGWFALTNFQDVEVNVWLFRTTAPLFIVIVLCLLLGLGVGYVAGRRGGKRRAQS